MNEPNKLESLQAFQPSLLFTSKAWAYMSETPFRCSNLGYAYLLWHPIKMFGQEQAQLAWRGGSQLVIQP